MRPRQSPATAQGDALFADAAERLAAARQAVLRVFHVWSAGDSEDGRETIVFRSTDGQPRTATFWSEDGRQQFDVRDGW